MTSIKNFFIIGNPRSGTTLLRLLLSSHTNIIVPPESGFIIKLFSKYNCIILDHNTIEHFISELYQIDKFESWKLNKKNLKENINTILPCKYPEILDFIYRFYGQQIIGKNHSIWGDKNNFYLKHIPQLHKIFPQSKYIHIIRDGRDVACSYLSLASIEGKYAPNFSNSLIEIAKTWNKNINIINKDLSNLPKNNVLEIRYEDLVNNPDQTLTKVCNFLGFDYEENMLDYYKQKNHKIYEPKEFDKWKSMNKKAISTDKIEIWKKQFFAEDIMIFNKINRDLLRQYQYEIPEEKISKFKVFTKYLFS